MPTKFKDEIEYPPNADKKLLKQFEKDHREERSRRSKEEHESFIAKAEEKAKTAEVLVKHLGLKPEDREQIEKYYRELSEKRQKSKRPSPDVKALQGHNIARYAPFDGSGYSQSWGGIAFTTLNGPNASTGQIGADNATYAPGGGISTQSSVGFWYWAGRSTTLQVVSQVSAYAQGEVVAGLIGYSEAYIGLRTTIKQWMNPSAQASGETSIYDVSGILAFHLRMGRGGEIFTASVSMPVLAGNWYLITAEAIQRAYSGVIGFAESTFYAGVGPITYTEH